MTKPEELPITPGEWFIPTMGGPYHVPGTTASGEGDWCYYINSRTEQRFGPSSTHGNTAEEAKANAVLVADAGTTYNRTKVLPSVMASELAALRAERAKEFAVCENRECYRYAMAYRLADGHTCEPHRLPDPLPEEVPFPNEFGKPGSSGI